MTKTHTDPYKRIDMLEKQIDTLATEGLKLFDPKFGGTAFENIGSDHKVSLIPQMGAEIECCAWPEGGFHKTTADGKLEHFLECITETSHSDGDYTITTHNPVRELTGDSILNNPRPSGNIDRLYIDTAKTLLEATIPFDHPRHKGSPVMCCRLIEGTKNLIQRQAYKYGVAHIDFRAFPEPTFDMYRKLEREVGPVSRIGQGDYEATNNDPTISSKSFPYISTNALQFSLSFKDAKDATDKDLFGATDYIKNEEGSATTVTGTRAVYGHIQRELFNMPEIHLAAGFDTTEIQRFKKYNELIALQETTGVPARIKKRSFKDGKQVSADRIENGILSPTCITSVGALCTLTAAYKGIKDNLQLEDDGTIKVEPCTAKSVDFERDDSSPHLARPNPEQFRNEDGSYSMKRLPESYDEMIAEAKASHNLKDTLNELSDNRLGDKLVDALVERAELIQQLISQNKWHGKHTPERDNGDQLAGVWGL